MTHEIVLKPSITITSFLQRRSLSLQFFSCGGIDVLQFATNFGSSVVLLLLIMHHYWLLDAYKLWSSKVLSKDDSDVTVELILSFINFDILYSCNTKEPRLILWLEYTRELCLPLSSR